MSSTAQRCGVFLALLTAITGCVSGRIVRPSSIDVPRADGASIPALAVAHQVIAATPGLVVRWHPSAGGGPAAVQLRAAGERAPNPIPQVRSTIASLPKRWRRPALKTMAALGLEVLDASGSAEFAEAAAERLRGDPVAAAARLERAGGPNPSPLFLYTAGAARLEADDFEGAAAILARLGEDPVLPGPLADVARAVRSAVSGDPVRSLAILEDLASRAPSLSEAHLLRARLRRTYPPLWDAAQVVGALRAALASNPCCPGCALHLADAESFTGRAEEAASLLEAATDCSTDAVEAARSRALALALVASGRVDEGLARAGEAEALDASALLPGLAPAYLLSGDIARLSQSYDSEADARLPAEISAQHHFWMGLADMSAGRPSEAAVQFERAEEHEQALIRGGGGSPARRQIEAALRIRAYLAAGRIEEAQRASDAVREDAEDVDGMLAYTAALADVAGGDMMGALRRTQRLTRAGEKYWRYLIRAEVALAKGRLRDASAEVNLALMGIDTQVSIAPGIPSEVYVLEAQARVLLALDRPRDAIRILDRLTVLGPRATFAPDLAVSAWLLLGRAREATGDRPGAETAWREIVARWGSGENAPAVQRARELLDAPRDAGPGGV